MPEQWSCTVSKAADKIGTVIFQLQCQAPTHSHHFLGVNLEIHFLLLTLIVESASFAVAPFCKPMIVHFPIPVSHQGMFVHKPENLLNIDRAHSFLPFQKWISSVNSECKKKKQQKKKRRGTTKNKSILRKPHIKQGIKHLPR